MPTLLTRTLRLFCVAMFALGVMAGAQRGPSGGQWPNHSGDKGSTKYSPLDQITRNNVGRLRIAWRRPAVAAEVRARRPDMVVANLYRSTPLMIDGVLYASDGVGFVEAFDPATGRTIWVQEPLEPGLDAPGGAASRGVAYSRIGDDERVLAVRPPYLVALHPKTGEFIRTFGDGGKVDLRLGLGAQPYPYNWTSAPLVIKDVVVIGSSLADNPNSKEGIPGDVRAYDLKTGRLRWKFTVIPRGRRVWC